jgi:hypothetical protein
MDGCFEAPMNLEKTELFIAQANIWLNFFEASKSTSANVWILSDEISLGFDKTYDFGSENLGCSIIDQFDGRRPFLINSESIKCIEEGRKQYIKFLPCVLFDSQMLTHLSRYLNNPSQRESHYGYITELLQFTIHKSREIHPQGGLDINPSFYFVESIMKNGFLRAKDFSNSAAITTLRLHTMNEDAFLENGTIIPDTWRIKLYADKCGLSIKQNVSIDELVPLWTDAMFSNYDQKHFEAFEDTLNYTYASLLKMILIHKSGRKGLQSFEEKISTFWDFLEGDLGIVMGREMSIAAYYFSNKLPDNFIQVQATMSFPKVRKKLLATAWDFFLLRMPELMLQKSTEEESILCYVCSADRAVREIGRLFTVISTISFSSDKPGPITISTSLEKLVKDLGQDFVGHYLSQQDSREAERNRTRIANGISPINNLKLKELIHSLEQNIQTFCLP